MTAATRSYFGLAKQGGYHTTATPFVKVTPTDDALFSYMLFNQGAAGINNVTVPLDSEIGGGAMLRDVIKAGYSSGGALEFIPRPDTLGTLLMSFFGNDAYTIAGVDPSKHVFTLTTADQFAAPYYTARFSPGGMWWEQYANVRVNALTLDFKAAAYLRGSVGFVGGESTKIITPATGVTLSLEPPFTAPRGIVQILSGTDAKALSGSFTMGAAIPLDEQFIVGSNIPDGLDITQRAFALSLNIKVADNTLYQKMVYDPAAGSTWAAQMMADASFALEFSSEKDSSVALKKHRLLIAGNSGKKNVIWSATPLGLRSGRQVIMNVTGIFMAVDTGDPITVTLWNDQVGAY